VQKALNAANGRAYVPVAIPVEKSDGAPDNGLPSTLVLPPPTTIADITAILDEEKPDPKVVAQLRADADAEPPSGADRARLAKFHYDRCQARHLLGELRGALPDCERAVQLGEGAFAPGDFGSLLQGLALQYWYAGESRKSLDVFMRMRSQSNVKGTMGYQFNAYRHIVERYIELGDLDQAEANVRRSEALILEARGWPDYSKPFFRAHWEADVERARGWLLAARGQYRQAETAFHRAEILKTEGLRNQRDDPHQIVAPASQIQEAIDGLIALEGVMKSRQGRFGEGEADARRALLSRLRTTGKYQVVTARFIGRLANQLVEQGRYVEAEQLTRAQLDILRALRLAEETENIASALSQLAAILNLEGRWSEAAAVYAELDRATASWTPAHREALTLSDNQIATFYNTNNLPAGIAAAERLLQRQRERFGDQHLETALARGILAIGLARSDREAEALSAFKQAMPILLSGMRETDTDEAIQTAAREQRLRVVIEAYIALLSHGGAADATAESFRLADLLRGRSVQRALAASSARAAAGDPTLAGLVRKEQDLEKQVIAELSVLNSALGLPSAQRDDKVVKALAADIEKLRAARDAANRDVAGRFPRFATLVDPQPPSLVEAQALLHNDEVLVAFLTTGAKSPPERTFVWAITSTEARWRSIGLDATSLQDEVRALRCGLDYSLWQDTSGRQKDTDQEGPNLAQRPHQLHCLDLKREGAPPVFGADGRLMSLPGFDLARSHALYRALFGQIEDLTKGRHLIVVPSGALTQLPFQVLVTAAPDPTLSGTDALRRARWLMRDQDISVLPSVSSLRALRAFGKPSRATKPMVGFGNPLLEGPSPAYAELAIRARANTTCPVEVASLSAEPRGVPALLLRGGLADVAQIRSAPPLPETADELCAVAADLHVVASDIYLGARATEAQVRSLSDAGELQNFRLVHFATHGALAGQVGGSSEPGLILTPPATPSETDDGYLSASKIAGLKLDADWVILSACNTAAGGSGDAEALSGLARAFFYAGTRALLVSHWSVDSAATVRLITGAINRMSTDPSIGRAEALRQAMLTLVDEGSETDAHPATWAPFVVVGEGG
jgi:CHAT domain-containing protein/tetratricopeptide (TPR) repeat protein